EPEPLRFPGGMHEVHDVAADPLVEVDRVDRAARGLDALHRHDRLRRRWRGASHAIEDRALLLGTRIAHLDLEEEAIHLRLGKRIGALLLDRVLRREYPE